MYLGTYVCGYLAGMGLSAKVILTLTDTSVYSGRRSLDREQLVPRSRDLWNVTSNSWWHTGFLGVGAPPLCTMQGPQ